MVFLIVIFLSSSLLNLESVQCSKEITQEELREYIREKQWFHPSCILFHNSTQSQIKKFENAQRKLQKASTLPQQHSFFRIHLNEAAVVDPPILSIPHVKCFVQKSKPEVYFFSRKSLSKWMSFMISNPTRIHIFSVDNIEKLSKRNNVLIYLVFPTHQYFDALRKTFTKIIETWENEAVDYYFVPPGTDIERALNEKLEIEGFPSVFIYHRRKKHHRLTPIASLHGPYEVNEDFIQLYIIIEKMRGYNITTELFQEVMTGRQYPQDSPTILAIYSPSSSKSYKFLHAFRRTIEAFKVDYHLPTVEFGIVDISNFENNRVLSRHIKFYGGWKIPFILCVHINHSATGENRIIQNILSDTPTLHSMKLFLHDIGLLQRDITTATSYWSNSTCMPKESYYCGPGDDPLLYPLPLEKKVKKMGKNQKKNAKKIGNVDIICDNSWDTRFTLSATPNIDILKGREEQTSRFILVVFISEGCSYCKMILPELQLLSKSVQYMDNVSLFLMNCTSSKRKCSQYHVTGFPTLILFRIVPWYKHERCFPYESLLEPARVDYHGIFEASEILVWLSLQTLPTMKFVRNTSDERMHKDVRLVAHLYSKEFIQKYVHFSVRSQILPLQCFSMLCEILHSQVECLSVPEKGIRSGAQNEMFVSAIQYSRKDGAAATLFKFGKTMESTLNEEVLGDVVFHKPHKYNISHRFMCEDDHVKCMQVVVEFVKDHIRLPITHVNTEMFHSHQKGMSYMWDQPILLTLVHPDNVTDKSLFYQDLHKLAVRLYQKVTVAVLDVVMYYEWAHLFVPAGYWSKVELDDDHPVLLNYPRFCLVDLHDHNHAAFYPTANSSTIYPKGNVNVIHRLDIEEVEAFVEKYYTDKRSVLVETEQF